VYAQPSINGRFKTTGSRRLKSGTQTIHDHPRTEALQPHKLEETGELYVEACYLISKSEWNTAISILEKTTTLDSTFAEAWEALGLCYENLDANEMAFKSYQAAMALKPFDFQLMKQVAVLAEKLKAWEIASTYFQRYSKRHPNDIDAQFGWGVALECQERFSEAIDVYEGLLSRQPQHLPTINNLSGCFMSLNDYERAIAGFQTVLNVVPNFPRAILGLSIAQDLSGQMASAVLNYRRYLNHNPEGSHAETVRERLVELEEDRV